MVAVIIFFIALLINAPLIAQSGGCDFRGRSWKEIEESAKPRR